MILIASQSPELPHLPKTALLLTKVSLLGKKNQKKNLRIQNKLRKHSANLSSKNTKILPIFLSLGLLLLNSMFKFEESTTYLTFSREVESSKRSKRALTNGTIAIVFLNNPISIKMNGVLFATYQAN